MGLLGNCPECGFAVYEFSDYYYDEANDDYWHNECLPEDENIGYE